VEVYREVVKSPCLGGRTIALAPPASTGPQTELPQANRCHEIVNEWHVICSFAEESDQLGVTVVFLVGGVRVGLI